MVVDLINFNDTTRIRKEGIWKMDPLARYEGGNAIYSDRIGSKLTFALVGEYIYLHVFKGPTMGKFNIKIDDVYDDDFILTDLNSTLVYDSIIEINYKFTFQPHLVQIEVLEPPVYIDSIFGINIYKEKNHICLSFSDNSNVYLYVSGRNLQTKASFVFPGINKVGMVNQILLNAYVNNSSYNGTFILWDSTNNKTIGSLSLITNSTPKILDVPFIPQNISYSPAIWELQFVTDNNAGRIYFSALNIYTQEV